MNKKQLIYLSDEEVLKKFELEPNKSELITRLLSEYYTTNSTAIKKKIQHLQVELNKQEELLSIFNNEEKIIQNKKKQIEEEEIKELEKQSIINKIKDLYGAGIITEDDYYTCFDDGKIDIEKATLVLNKLQEVKK